MIKASYDGKVFIVKGESYFDIGNFKYYITARHNKEREIRPLISFYRTIKDSNNKVITILPKNKNTILKILDHKASDELFYAVANIDITEIFENINIFLDNIKSEYVDKLSEWKEFKIVKPVSTDQNIKNSQFKKMINSIDWENDQILNEIQAQQVFYKRIDDLIIDFYSIINNEKSNEEDIKHIFQRNKFLFTLILNVKGNDFNVEYERKPIRLDLLINATSINYFIEFKRAEKLDLEEYRKIGKNVDGAYNFTSSKIKSFWGTSIQLQRYYEEEKIDNPKNVIIGFSISKIIGNKEKMKSYNFLKKQFHNLEIITIEDIIEKLENYRNLFKTK